MLYFDKIDRHANLMFRVADTMRADLADALIDGRLSPQNLRAAVLRCTRCTHAAECDAWSETHAETGSDAAPPYCLNREVLETLRGA